MDWPQIKFYVFMAVFIYFLVIVEILIVRYTLVFFKFANKPTSKELKNIWLFALIGGLGMSSASSSGYTGNINSPTAPFGSRNKIPESVRRLLALIVILGVSFLLFIALMILIGFYI